MSCLFLLFKCIQKTIPVIFSSGSPAYEAFLKVVMAPALLRDLKKVSPSCQTYGLESFHSVLIKFAPKSLAFSNEGMRARSYLAILHFNENSKRLQAQTAEGEDRWNLKAPKARKDHLAAFPLTTEPTYEYVDTLFNEVLERLQRLPSFREANAEVSTLPPPPPPMIARVQPRPPKQNLVAVHRSRFGKN